MANNKPNITGYNCLTPDQNWLRLWEAEYQQNSIDKKWAFVSRKDVPKLEETPDAVQIIATVSDTREPYPNISIRRLVVTKEFRIPIGDYEYSLPAGLIEPGEDAGVAALRELEEETGLKGEVLYIGPVIYSSGGLTNESSVMVFVDARGEMSQDKCEESECIESMLLDDTECLQLLKRTGRFEGVKIGAKLWNLLAGKFLY